MNFLFYLFSTLALVSGGMVIQARNPVHSVLYLILVFFNAAGLLILLGLDFFAMIFLVVYVGAIAVLFLFVVMMLNINLAEFNEKRLRYLPMAGLLCLLFLTILNPRTGITRLWEKKYPILLKNISYIASFPLIITFLFFWMDFLFINCDIFLFINCDIFLYNAWIIENCLVPLADSVPESVPVLPEISYKQLDPDAGAPALRMHLPPSPFERLVWEPFLSEAADGQAADQQPPEAADQHQHQQDADQQDPAEQGEQPTP